MSVPLAGALHLHRDQRFPLRRALPRPGEDELLVGNDLAIDAADAVLLAARHLHDDAVAATDLEIGLRDEDLTIVAGSEPLLQRLRVRPRAEDFFDRDGVVAFEPEARLFEGCCHVSLSK